MAIRDSIKKF
jgi:hypothetical protein